MKKQALLNIFKVSFLYLSVLFICAVLSSLFSSPFSDVIVYIPNFIFLLLYVIYYKCTNKKNNFANKINYRISFLILSVLLSVTSFIFFSNILLNSNHNTITNFSIRVFILLLFHNIFTAVVEELIFRKIILNELNKIFNIYAAIIIQGAIFGLCHASNLNHILTCSILGICWGILFYSTGSLLYCVIVHSLYNLLCNIITANTYLYTTYLKPILYDNNIVFFLTFIFQIIILYMFIKSKRSRQ